MSEVRISYFSVENVGGITDPVRVNFGQRKPGEGQLVVLTGPNGAGKSSFLDGVREMFLGGHNPSVIHTGAEKAVIRMGTTDGAEYIRTITQAGYYLKGIGPDGLKFDPPESQMKRMATGFAFDPIAFDQAAMSRDGKKKQLDFFLKVLPMTFKAAEISLAMGAAAKIVTPPAGDQDIVGIGKLLKELTDKRAAISSARDEKANSVETFRRSLPAEDSGEQAKDWRAELARLTKERNDLEAAELGDIEGISDVLKKEHDRTFVQIRAAEDMATNEYQRLLVVARGGKTEHRLEGDLLITVLTEIRNHYQQCCDNSLEASTAIATIKTENAVTRERLSAELATVQAANDAQQRSAGIRESMVTLQKEALALSGKRDAVAASVKAIEALKLSKLTDLSVQDVEAREDGLYLDGRPWARANQARRWLKSIEIGCQGPGDLDVMVVDEGEHLDQLNWEEFTGAVIQSGRTVIAARVGSGTKLATEPAEALVMA